MANQFISARIPERLFDAVESYRQISGEERSKVVITALANHVGLKLDEIEEGKTEASETLEKVKFLDKFCKNIQITIEDLKLENESLRKKQKLIENRLKVIEDTKIKNTEEEKRELKTKRNTENEDEKYSTQELAAKISMDRKTIAKIGKNLTEGMTHEIENKKTGEKCKVQLISKEQTGRGERLKWSIKDTKLILKQS